MAGRQRLGTALGAMAVALAMAGAAQAQEYVRADCRPQVPSAKIADPLTARWYRRFWTGSCDGLSGCMGGSPNWNDIVGQLVARSRPADRAAVLTQACRLGPLIGIEWTRPRNLRRIDSGDLRGFKNTLQTSADVLTGIRKVEAASRAKIAGGT